MGKVLLIWFLLTSAVFAHELAEDRENFCKYETKVISENGTTISKQEIKICNEFVKINQDSLIKRFFTEEEFQNTFVLSLMFLMENIL